VTLTRIERRIIESSYWARKRQRETAVLLSGLDLARKRILNVGAAHSPLRAEHLPGAAGIVNLDIVGFRGLDLVADGRRLPFGDEQFDIVMFQRVLHHIHDFDQALHQALRCARTGGLLLLSEPYHQAIALIRASGLDSHPRRVLTTGDVEQFARRNGLRVIRKWHRLYWFYYGYQLLKCQPVSTQTKSNSQGNSRWATAEH
jgi:SAM-dependent methyltransferase